MWIHEHRGWRTILRSVWSELLNGHEKKSFPVLQITDERSDMITALWNHLILKGGLSCNKKPDIFRINHSLCSSTSLECRLLTLSESLETMGQIEATTTLLLLLPLKQINGFVVVLLVHSRITHRFLRRSKEPGTFGLHVFVYDQPTNDSAPSSVSVPSGLRPEGMMMSLIHTFERFFFCKTVISWWWMNICWKLVNYC